MEKIRTIESLIKELDSGIGYKGMYGLLHRLDLDEHDVQKFASWNSDRYTRNRLYGTVTMEVLLLCFEEGQESSIHDLDSQEGWMDLCMYYRPEKS